MQKTKTIDDITYKINNFIIIPTSDNQVILQNDYGIVRITNKLLINLLNKMDSQKVKYLPIADIKEIFSENHSEVISFLKKHGILEENNKKNFNIKKMWIASNNSDISSSMKQFINIDEGLEVEFLTIDELIQLNSFPSNTFCFLFLNPYSKNKAKIIRDKFCESPNSFLVTSYIYNNNLHVDSPFNSIWKTPCHICQIGLIEEKLRNSGEINNYQTFIDDLYEKEPLFQVETQLSKSQILNVTTILVNRIEQFVGVNKLKTIQYQEINRALIMNLNDNYLASDATIHWEYCDCYQ
jgi:McbB family protein